MCTFIDLPQLGGSLILARPALFFGGLICKLARMMVSPWSGTEQYIFLESSMKAGLFHSCWPFPRWVRPGDHAPHLLVQLWVTARCGVGAFCSTQVSLHLVLSSKSSAQPQPQQSCSHHPLLHPALGISQLHFLCYSLLYW